MKVLFIANSRIPTERAMGTAIMKQCEAFSRKKIDVELIVPRRYNSLTENAYTYHSVDQIFKIRFIPCLDLTFLGKTNIRFIIQRITFIVALQFIVWTSDALMLYSREPELLGLLLTHKKRFVELHHRYGLNQLGKYLLHKCTGIITITHALKKDVSQEYAYPLERICVAPSGIDLRAYKKKEPPAIVRSKLNIPNTKPVIMYIGSLETWKGYKTFLDSCFLLKEKITSVLIGGTNEQIEYLKKDFPHTLFLGQLPQVNLPFNQRAADVLIIPNSAKEDISSKYTSPLKLFAHMASGIPIVASATQAICEILSEQSAVLVKPDNPKAFADGIVFALENKKEVYSRALVAEEEAKKYEWNIRTDKIIGFVNTCKDK